MRSLAAARHPERFKRSRTLQDDPYARFYMEQNPRFEEGTRMLIWIPLDIGNLGRALVRLLLGDPAR